MKLLRKGYNFKIIKKKISFFFLISEHLKEYLIQHIKGETIRLSILQNFKRKLYYEINL